MYALLFDANLCGGCESCVWACQEKNALPEEGTPMLSEKRFTVLEQLDEDVFTRRMCMHCLQPSCASACPVAALKKTPEGPVVYDYDRCIGCRYCMVACPFSVPRYEWSSRTPRVRKCQMCFDRVSAGKPTACAEACPTGATSFGERTALIAEAWRRIAEEPDEYANKVYGVEEAGGTCVLIIGPQAVMDALDPNVPREALPEKTWAVLSQLPASVSAVGAGLIGINWFIRRRMRIAEVENGGNGNARAEFEGEALDSMQPRDTHEKGGAR